MTGSGKRTAVRVVVGTAGMAIAVVVLFALAEGFASVILFGYDLFSSRERVHPERRHTQYDRELGWVAVPNLRVKDMYGPGIDLSTNAQGFRNHDLIATRVAPGKARVICSGDSFTLGFGVSDDEAWCGLLSARNASLETVNMGQGGYGIDQAYLWYLRDGNGLDHQVHVFAFITDDFARMQWDTFFGYGKPRLALHDGSLVVTNVPVPRVGFLVPWLTTRRGAVRDLRLVGLMDRVLGRLGSVPTDSTPIAPAVVNDSTVWAVATHVFERLAVANRSKGSRLVLVYLPIRPDYRSATADAWRERVSRWAQEQHVDYVDLVASFKQLPAESVPAMFIPKGEVGERHLTPRGNAWVAEQLFERVFAAPKPNNIPPANVPRSATGSP